MPKRKCPFGDATPLQLKTHVGFKETATDSDMQEVYGELHGQHSVTRILPRPFLFSFLFVLQKRPGPCCFRVLIPLAALTHAMVKVVDITGMAICTTVTAKHIMDTPVVYVTSLFRQLVSSQQ